VRKDGHHPIIYMQCGPIRFNFPVRSQVASSPSEHRVVPRTTTISWNQQTAPKIQELYALHSADAEAATQYSAPVLAQRVRCAKCQPARSSCAPLRIRQPRSTAGRAVSEGGVRFRDEFEQLTDNRCLLRAQEQLFVMGS
jgi:hypothetical protein